MSKVDNNLAYPISLAHPLIGGKWKTQVLWHILHGERRFSSLKRALPQITEKVLYTTLRELESDGIIFRKVNKNVQPPSVSYYMNSELSQLTRLIETLHQFTIEYADYRNIELDPLRLTKK